MTGVLRSHLDVTPAVLTDILRQANWIPDDVSVVDAGITTIGAGQMGICARYDLQLDRDVADAPVSVVGKFAAADEQARTFMASSGYPNEVCFYRDFASRVTIRVPRCAHAAIDDDGWFTLLLEDLSPMQPGDQLQGARCPRWRRRCTSSSACTRRCGTHRLLQEHPQFSSSGLADPSVLAEALQARRARLRRTLRPRVRARRGRLLRASGRPRRAAGSRRARRPAASCTATSGPTT